MQLAYLIQQQGLHTTLIQSICGFRFYQLAEIRYFFKKVSARAMTTITHEKWSEAKTLTLEKYRTSRCINALKQFFSDFEQTHQTFYLSDLREYLLESNIEDFVSPDNNSIFISTIHKAKGREFDTVHLVAPTMHNEDSEALRALYVGLTRAKSHLYIHTHNTPLLRMAEPVLHNVPRFEHVPLSITLLHRDVFLGFSKDKKQQLLALRSGDPLRYENYCLFSTDGNCVVCLSKAKKEEFRRLESKGYHVVSAEVSYVVAWRPKDEDQEYAVCLPTLYLTVT